jgi:putative oxidoreductase
VRSIKTNATALYNAVANFVNLLRSPLLLVVRLYWVWQFFHTGWGKLQDIAKVTDFFTSLGLPLPNVTAYVVGTSECVGGVLLFFGLGSRLISLPLLADMIGAYVTADREALKAIFSEPGKFYAADPYTFLFASLLILVFGPGKISVDALIERLIRREKRVLVGPSSSIALAGR